MAVSNSLPVVSDAAEAARKFRPDVYWYLSFRCNLACKHCSVFSSPWVDTSEDLTVEECLTTVEQMAELNVRTAILTGGEITIRPGYLEIMEALLEAGINCGVETNGLRFTGEFTEFGRKAQQRGKMSITVSLDGGTAETHDALRGSGSFARTVRGLRTLNDAGITFSLQAVLNRGNFQSIPDLYALAQELRPNLRSVNFGFLNPVGRGKELVGDQGLRYEDLLQIFALIRDHKPRFEGRSLIKLPPAAIPPQFLALTHSADVAGCVTCQFPLLGILPNGDVTICALSRDRQDLLFGNVKSMRLHDMWWQARMDLLRSSYVAADHLTGICGDCVWQKRCKGSCRAWAYEEGGSFDSPFPICQSMADNETFPESYRLSKAKPFLAGRGGGDDRPLEVEAGCGCS